MGVVIPIMLRPDVTAKRLRSNKLLGKEIEETFTSYNMTAAETGKHLGTDDVCGKDELWHRGETNPDFRLITIHAANQGFQSKIDSENLDQLSWDMFYKHSSTGPRFPKKISAFNRLIGHTKNFFIISGYGAFTPGYMILITKEFILILFSIDQRNIFY